MTSADFLSLANAANQRVPHRFVDFCRWLKVELTPGQRVLAMVAFDGAEPRDLAGADRDIARRLFGKVDVFPAQARHVLVAVCGGRAGKSYVLDALRMLHLALIVPLTTLAPGERAAALMVAPDKRLASQVLRYVVGAIGSREELKRRVVSETAESVVIQRDDGVVSLEVLPATRGGSAVRGRSLVGCALDECAFFRDDSYQVNDTELYRAVAPRILRGGQLVLSSTPWTETGLLWEFFSRNHGHPVDAIAAHAPTLLLRDNEDTRAYVARERQRDPDNASREFDAEFMAGGADDFFESAAIRDSVDPLLEMPVVRGPHETASVGADFGFRSDSSALVVALRDQAIIRTAAIEERRPEKGKPLKPSAVVGDFALLSTGYSAEYIVADSHYRESIAEHLEPHRLALVTAPEGANGKAETYQLARQKLREGRIKLPNHERLLRQLHEVKARPTAGGGITIASPRWRTGGHGDIVSAWVLAVWDAARQMPAQMPVVYATPVDREVAEWEARIAKNIAAAERGSDEWDGFGPE